MIFRELANHHHHHYIIIISSRLSNVYVFLFYYSFCCFCMFVFTYLLVRFAGTGAEAHDLLTFHFRCLTLSTSHLPGTYLLAHPFTVLVLA